MASNTQPAWPHDCEDCVYLGRVQGKDEDLYVHPEDAQTVIHRYGREPEDYISGLDFIEHVPELALAYVRAVKGGYIQNR